MKKPTLFSLLFSAALVFAGCTAQETPSGSQPVPEGNSSLSQTSQEESLSSESGGQSESDVEEEFQFLSVTLLSTIEGEVVEIFFTDPDEVASIAGLIVDQEDLDSEEHLEILEDLPAISATVQDGPGSNFKLTLLPATDLSTGEDILLIRGELFSFYTDIHAYETLLAEMAQKRK